MPPVPSGYIDTLLPVVLEVISSTKRVPLVSTLLVIFTAPVPSGDMFIFPLLSVDVIVFSFTFIMFTF